MKLKVGDKIEIVGFVWLKGLESRQKYKVVRISKANRIAKNFEENIYWFSKARGKKEIIGHYAKDVDLWVNIERTNNNRIDVIN